MAVDTIPVETLTEEQAAERDRILLAGLAEAIRGIVTMRQRPQTASGVTFVTLEDEDGSVSVVIWQDLGERQRRELANARLLAVDGRWEKVDGVSHLIAGRLHDFSHLMGALQVSSHDYY